jgi:hypothetical protein
MRGHAHVSPRHDLGLVVSSALSLVVLTGAATSAAPSAATEALSVLPRCSPLAGATQDDGVVVKPWRELLDDDGAVVGHRLVLRRDGVEHDLRTGRRSFAVPLAGHRLLIGQRNEEGTRLTMLDTRRACRLWARRLDEHAYPEPDATTGALRLALHDRDTRVYQLSRTLDAETGATEAESQEACLEGCYASDGDLGLAALEPAGAALPTPNFPAGAWPKDKKLSFRWKSGAAPPSWARSPMKSAGDDARDTSFARSPRFPYVSDAPNAVAYTGSLPMFCSSRAIACARRAMPSFWGVWIRPYGTDFSWGTLRWCQKTSSGSGCFDLRRVMLHELGHIVGLDHPSNAGFTLSSSDSIMQGITPARPNAGSSRHAFGRCDVATLQELYDTPDNKTAISTCNDVATGVTLSASRSSLPLGSRVTLTAQLKVGSSSTYRQLASNPLNGRALKLKYRRAGSDDAWKTLWMRSLYSSGRYELSIAPSSSWELKAVFPTPDDEGLRYSRSAIRKVKVTQ